MAEALDAVASWPISQLLRGSQLAYAIVNATHILAIGILIGSIAVLDLRLLGAFRNLPIGLVAPTLSRVAASGLLVAILTGALLFSVRPSAYLQNPAFLTKLVLVALGVCNALLLRANSAWRSVHGGAEVPGLIRVTALVSLLIWVTAIFAGRWIAFLQ